jgi:prolyl oligopeptidase
MRKTSATIASLAAVLSMLTARAQTVPPTLEALSKPDRFTWLETPKDPAALDWAARQTAAALSRIEKMPAFAGIEREIKAVDARNTPTPSYYLLGDKLIRFVRDGDHPLGVFEMTSRQEIGRASWRVVLDVAAYNSAHRADFQIMFLDLYEQCLAPAFMRCLIPFAAGGSSLIQYREFDFATGRFIENGFNTPPVRAGAGWLDVDTLVIGHSLGDVPALKSGFPGALYRWRRGTPLAQSEPIFKANPGDSLIGSTPMPAGSPGRLAISLARDYQTFEVSLMDRAGKPRRLELPTGLQKFGSPLVVGRQLVFQLTRSAVVDGRTYGADTLLAYDPEARAGARVSVIAAATKDSYINDAYLGLTATRNGIAFVETHNLRKTLVFARPASGGGWTLTRSLRADPGVAMSLSSSGVDDAVVVQQAGFLKPTEIDIVTPDGGQTALYVAQPVIDASAYVSEIRSARSQDGTMVDFYLVRPKVRKPGPVPTIIAGYGGYGVNYEPNYFSGGLGAALVPWLERGGAYALAAIRGGGERGSAWADAARGTRRQRSYDDFIAVAETLIENGFTAPRKIGSFGRSFGGLLSANVAVQRPDLFGAALVGVPIVDLFRLGRGGIDISAGQKVEVGNWDDPAQVPSMVSYSPYQNIREGVVYPRVLTLVSAEDGQVGPGHGRKFTAKLQSVGAEALLIEGPSGGHRFPDPLANPTEFAAQMTFFVDALMGAK